jgi:hypothetical protein
LAFSLLIPLSIRIGIEKFTGSAGAKLAILTGNYSAVIGRTQIDADKTQMDAVFI